jgi:orotidine-5'-phosphate decarboxylase
MKNYQKEFTDFLISKGLLWVGQPGELRALKSKRTSPYFVDTGSASDGDGLYGLTLSYASKAAEIGKKRPFDTIYGPPDKGTALTPPIAVLLSTKGLNKRWLIYRSKFKETAKAPLQQRFVGDIHDGDIVLLVDDVITTGGAKYEALEQLSVAANNLRYKDLIISFDRQELGPDGRTSAIKAFEEDTGMKVNAVLKLGEVLPYLVEKGVISPEQMRYMQAYTRTYCIEDLKRDCRDIRIVERDKGIIPACDVSLEKFKEIAKATADIDSVTAYKVGLMALIGGLDRWVKTAREYTDKPIIYDHQKAGNDIPDMGRKFAEVMKRAGVNAAILFPFTGPLTESEWIKALYEEGVEPIVGGEMTHPLFKLVEGGYIPEEKCMEIYLRAACAGVNNFVVPGNKPEQVEKYRTAIESEISGIKPTYYSPGFVKQGGKIQDAAKVAGKKWNAIVGRAITTADNPRKAAIELSSALG